MKVNNTQLTLKNHLNIVANKKDVSLLCSQSNCKSLWHDQHGFVLYNCTWFLYTIHLTKIFLLTTLLISRKCGEKIWISSSCWWNLELAASSCEVKPRKIQVSLRRRGIFSFLKKFVTEYIHYLCISLTLHVPYTPRAVHYVLYTTRRTLRTCCSQSECRILKIHERSTRALFLCTHPSSLCSWCIKNTRCVRNFI